jgi:hypothetical protein
MESIKADRLLETDDFKLTKTKNSGKRFISLLTFRSVRTEFTPEDDTLLKNFLEKSDHPNGAFSLIPGTMLYKDIAKAHPNHPWQSWRNRALKTILHINKSTGVAKSVQFSPEMEDELEDDDLNNDTVHGTSKQEHLIQFSPEMDDELEEDGLNNDTVQGTSKQQHLTSPKMPFEIIESSSGYNDLHQTVVKKSKVVGKGNNDLHQTVVKKSKIIDKGNNDLHQPFVKKSKIIDKGKGSIIQSSISSKFDINVRNAS